MTVSLEVLVEIVPQVEVVSTPYAVSLGASVPDGGTTGQVLTKESNADGDAGWENPAGGGGAVDSVNGQVGVVALDAADIPFTPAGTIAATDSQGAIAEVASDAASALSAHEAASDPHPGYALYVVATSQPATADLWFNPTATA